MFSAGNLLNEYQYSALIEPDSIRLVVLYPSRDSESGIECDIIHTRLSATKNNGNGYTALSYVWGDIKQSHSVSIGPDTQLLIGQNLHCALSHLRRHDRPIRLWVDAICINQFDLTERNHQVEQMRMIYSFAQETVIYLGDQDGGNTGYSAWNYLEKHSLWAMNHHHDKDYNIPASFENLTEFRGGLEDVEIDVLRRAWFRRVWVLQEVVVSENVSIQCGLRKFPGTTSAKHYCVDQDAMIDMGLAWEGTIDLK